MSDPRPHIASVAELRAYFDEALAQLLTDMHTQAINYWIAADVFELVERVSKVVARDVREILASWALRHALPAWDLWHRSGALSDEQLATLSARLRDLLGYVVLALMWIAREQERRKTP